MRSREVNLGSLTTELQRIDISESWQDLHDAARMRSSEIDLFTGSVLGIYSQMFDRSEGKNRPHYQDEMDLNRIRAFAWGIDAFIPMAGAWQNRLVDYTIGTGFDLTIKAVGGANEEYGRAAHAWVDRVLQNCNWSSGLERESFEREVTDGEFLASIECSSGSVSVVTCEGNHLTEPANSTQLEDYLEIDFVPCWKFGVLTQQFRTDIPFGYHIVRDEIGADWSFYEEREFVHWKRNVRARAKRGLTDFFRPQVYLCQANRAIGNTATGAAIQASIAYIVEHAPGVTGRQAEPIINSGVFENTRNPRTGTTEVRKRDIGSHRIDVSSGKKFSYGPLGQSNSKIFIEVVEACLRMAGTVVGFPEGMLTGSYANNNMASALIAESPFVQGRVADQASRAQRNRSLFEKIIRMGISLGVFKEFGVTDPNGDLHLIIESIPSKVFPRDVRAMTEALKLQKEQGWVSDKTAMTELGRDYAAEVANGMKPIEDNSNSPEQEAGAEPLAGGSWLASNKRELTRYADVIASVEKQLIDRTITPTRARIILRGIGVPAEDIELLIKDARDGVIDAPIDRQQPAAPVQNNQTAAPMKMRESTRAKLKKRRINIVRATIDHDNDVVSLAESIGFDPSQPRGKDGKWIYTGVNTSAWSKTNSAAKWGKNKIAQMQKYASLGQWDKVASVYSIPDHVQKPNQYQKGVEKAKETILAQKYDWVIQPPKGAIDIPETPAKAGWSKVGEQLGTENGGTYIGPDGKKYYVKLPDNEERATNEFLASQLYQMAGGKVVPATLVVVDGKMGVATQWVDDAKKIDWVNDHATRNAAKEDFALHAWLANWDAVGAGSENPMDNIKNIGGVPTLIDGGGSLEYKGMGGAGKKPFGEDVTELKTLKDPSINPTMAQVFGDMTPQETIDSINKLKAVSDDEIKKMVSNVSSNKELADTLIARKNNMLKYASDLDWSVNGFASDGSLGDFAGDFKGTTSEAGEKPKHEVEDTVELVIPGDKPKTAPEVLKDIVEKQKSAVEAIGPMAIPPKPVVTSKANQSAQKKFDAIYEAAASGDIEKVKAIPTNAESQQTYTKKHHHYKMAVLAAMESGGTLPMASDAGNVASVDSSKDGSTWKSLSVTDLPETPKFMSSNAEHVKQNAVLLAKINGAALEKDEGAFNAIASEIKSPKVKAYYDEVLHKLKGIGTSEDILQSFNDFDFSSDAVLKVGYWEVSAKETPIESSNGKWLTGSEHSEFHKPNYAAWDNLRSTKGSSDEAYAIQKYTGGAYHAMNDYLRTGKDYSDGKELAAKAINGFKKLAIPIPEGMMLSRKYSVNYGTALKSHKFVPGMVLSDKAFLSTSTDEYVWNGNVQFKLLVGKGVKGVSADSFSKNGGEKEVIIAPNQKMVVTNVHHGEEKIKVYATLLPTDLDAF